MRKPQHKRDVWDDVRTAVRLIDRPETVDTSECIDITIAHEAEASSIDGAAVLRVEQLAKANSKSGLGECTVVSFASTAPALRLHGARRVRRFACRLQSPGMHGKSTAHARSRGVHAWCTQSESRRSSLRLHRECAAQEQESRRWRSAGTGHSGRVSLNAGSRRAAGGKHRRAGGLHAVGMHGGGNAASLCIHGACRARGPRAIPLALCVHGAGGLPSPGMQRACVTWRFAPRCRRRPYAQ